jgi:hypothetical protein
MSACGRLEKCKCRPFRELAERRREMLADQRPITNFSILSEDVGAQIQYAVSWEQRTTRAMKESEIGNTCSEQEEQSSDPPSSESASPQESATEKQPETESKKSTDPLRWFGILVPPALRSAQSTFITAVEGPVPQLVTVARRLRNQEIEIGRVRKQIKKTQV